MLLKILLIHALSKYEDINIALFVFFDPLIIYFLP